MSCFLIIFCSTAFMIFNVVQDKLYLSNICFFKKPVSLHPAPRTLVASNGSIFSLLLGTND